MKCDKITKRFFNFNYSHFSLIKEKSEMFSVIIQSCKGRNITSIVTVCNTLEEGKNLFKDCVSKYVVSVYKKEGIQLFDFENCEDPEDAKEIQTFEIIKNKSDGFEWMKLENWDIDWKENDESYTLYMQKDCMSETWEEDTPNYWISCNIVDVKTSMKVVIAEHTYGTKVGKIEDLVNQVEDDSEDEVEDDSEDDSELEETEGPCHLQN